MFAGGAGIIAAAYFGYQYTQDADDSPLKSSHLMYAIAGGVLALVAFSGALPQLD
jgi:hypothetical protein